MASWIKAYGPYVQLRVTAAETNVNVAGNKSRVRVASEIYYPGGTASYNGYPQTLTVTVNGTQIGRQTGITYSLSTSSRRRTLTTYTSGDITHNADGSKSVNVTVNITDGKGDTANISGTLTLTTIPRASSISSFSNFTLKNDVTNSFSLGLSRASSSFTHNITLRVGSTNIQSWNGQGLPTSLTLTAASSNQILNLMRNSTSTSVQLRVQTRSGSTNIGSVLTKNATASIHSSLVPSIGAISVTENVDNIKNNLGVHVQNKSSVRISFSTVPAYGARDNTISVTFDGKTYNSKSFTSSLITGSGTRPIVVTYTNTRGQKVTRTQNVTVYAYSNPKPNITSAFRSNSSGTANENGEYVRVNFSSSISSLNGTNSATYQLQYKRSDASSYTTVNVSSSGNHTFTADPDYSYDIRFRATDFFTNVLSYAQILSTFSLINFAADGKGMAFGQTYDEAMGGILQVNGPAYFNNIASIRLEEGTNLNDITSPGFYYESASARAETMSNLPTSRAFSLFVERHAGTKQTFTQYDATTPSTWIRNYYNGTWGNWFRIQFV